MEVYASGRYSSGAAQRVFSGAGWHTNLSGQASVDAFHRGLTLSDVEIEDEYVAVTVGGTVRVHSYFASLAMSVNEFN